MNSKNQDHIVNFVTIYMLRISALMEHGMAAALQWYLILSLISPIISATSSMFATCMMHVNENQLLRDYVYYSA